MNFSTLFRLGENLNLDRKTLIILRWIAIIGQLTAINLVYFYLKLEFPILISHIILSIIVIPLVLHSYIRAYLGDIKAHKNIVKYAYPVWLYVAITGVIVYLMISPYYN